MSKRGRNFGNELRQKLLKQQQTRESLIQSYINRAGPIITSEKIYEIIMKQLIKYTNRKLTSAKISIINTIMYINVIDHYQYELEYEYKLPFLTKWNKIQCKMMDSDCRFEASEYVEKTYKNQLLNNIKHNLIGINVEKRYKNDAPNIFCKLYWNCECNWCMNSNDNPELYLLLLMRACKQPNVWNNMPKDLCKLIIPLIRNEIKLH